MPRLKPPAAKRTPAAARRCRYSHGVIRRLMTVTDREGVVLSSGACIGMPPAVGCPVICLDDMGGSSRAALAVRLGAEGIEAGWRQGRSSASSAHTARPRITATRCRTPRRAGAGAPASGGQTQGAFGAHMHFPLFLGALPRAANQD